MSAATATRKAQALASAQDTETLLLAYTASPGTVEGAQVRGWIMDELEARGQLSALAIRLDRCPACWAPAHPAGGCD